MPYEIAARNNKTIPPSTGKPGGGGTCGGGGPVGPAKAKLVKSSAKPLKILFGTILIGCKNK